ncbi:PrgH/EprH family type III secretion apparatus protein [Serratia silvae]|uniref:PrgH/EprH family type III secretion apparatus protein n=1 Tax=Serratia silvae TaxID=2824122 RepID=A0ABT0K9S9_9GAMM|nr:PrgH/EprH family type III secretion apparatus protein [Serratia silvae]MCL1028781.1 PrgH/EprH family type III secretion apparatus protein [Serratia silvae]
MIISDSSPEKNNVIIRLLSGVLRGCEFRLPIGRTLFLVTDDNELQCHHQGTVLAENMIFIPSKTECFNFEVDIEDVPEAAIRLRQLEDDEIHESALSVNQIICVGSLKLALRYADERFSEEIEHFQPSEPQDNDLPDVSRKARYWLAALVMAGSLVIGGAFYATSEQREVTSVASRLNAGIGDYDVISGRDGVMYVIASEVKGKAWASQTLAKSLTDKTVKVLTRQGVSDEVTQWFATKYPHYPLHRVVYDVPRQPSIEISRERTTLNSLNEADIVRFARQAFPYLERLQFNFVSDALVSDIAEQGLRKVSVPYSRVNNKKSVTFVIQGSLDDSEFERLKTFIDSYYSSWSGEYVQFAIEVKDDWLKGKSFKYGSRGYVKISPGHWYFPKPL